jgi:hypothetical protein
MTARGPPPAALMRTATPSRLPSSPLLPFPAYVPMGRGPPCASRLCLRACTLAKAPTRRPAPWRRGRAAPAAHACAAAGRRILELGGQAREPEAPCGCPVWPPIPPPLTPFSGRARRLTPRPPPTPHFRPNPPPRGSARAGAPVGLRRRCAHTQGSAFGPAAAAPLQRAPPALNSIATLLAAGGRVSSAAPGRGRRLTAGLPFDKGERGPPATPAGRAPGLAAAAGAPPRRGARGPGSRPGL